MAEDRKMPILAPRVRRKGAAAHLSAAERKSGVDTPVASTPSEDTIEDHRGHERNDIANPQTASGSASDSVQTSGRPVKRRPGSGKKQIAVDIPEDVRGKAVSAFRYAQFFERVPSWSEFVTNALEGEIRRIEAEHNGGRSLEPDHGPLPSGRPLKS